MYSVEQPVDTAGSYYLLVILWSLQENRALSVITHKLVFIMSYLIFLPSVKREGKGCLEWGLKGKQARIIGGSQLQLF